MRSIAATLTPKSDQLNADDLLGGKTLTIKITDVDIKLGDPQGQKLVIHYEGENGRPYKPCLGMRRVLDFTWGGDPDAWIGRSLTLHNDPTVKYGSEEMGGLRITHMSDIAQPMTMALTLAKARRKAFTVRPLHVALGPDRRPLEAAAISAAEIAGNGGQSFGDWMKTLSKEDQSYIKADIGRYQGIASKARAAKAGDASENTAGEAT